jgi:hypothetical protein
VWRECENLVVKKAKLGQTETDLMEDEGSNAGRNDGIANPQVPCHPVSLKPIKLCVVYVQSSVELGSCEVGRRAHMSGIKRHGREWEREE